MRGRLPKSADEHTRQGTRSQAGRTQKPGQLPDAAPLENVPAPPGDLSDPARTAWIQLAPELVAMGTLSRVDLRALGMYCRAEARYLEAEDRIAEEGAVVRGGHGGPIKNPWVTISESSVAQMLKIGAELGMTPATRSRIRRPKQLPRSVPGRPSLRELMQRGARVNG